MSIKVSLVVAEGANRGRSIAIRDASFVIGRDPGCQVRASSESISRRHCEILVGEDDVVIRDLGSTNGTLVNGEVIQEAEVLRHGDRIEVGPLYFLIRIVGSVPAAEQPTEMLAADATQVENTPQTPAPSSHTGEVKLNELGNDTLGEISASPTRADMPMAGPPTTRSRPKQPPPAGDEGVSKAASELIKKMMAKTSARRPPPGAGPPGPTR